MLFLCPVGDKHRGMVGGDGGRLCVCVCVCMCIRVCVLHVWLHRRCGQRMADVGFVSGGCDSGARSAYGCSVGTYGRSVKALHYVGVCVILLCHTSCSNMLTLRPLWE